MPPRGRKQEVTQESILRPPRAKDLDSPEKQSRISRKVTEAKQRLIEETQGKISVEREITFDGPVLVVNIADRHIGSAIVDYSKIDQEIEFIESTAQALCIFLGDLIEGRNPEYVATIEASTALTFTEQITELREKVLRVLEKKALGSVVDHAGHSWWSNQTSTLNADTVAHQGLAIPRLMQGGRIILKFPDQKIEFYVTHIPAKGSSSKNIVGGAEALSMQHGPSGADVYLSGHIHQKATLMRLNRDGTIALMTSEGTYKGTGRGKDAFMTSKTPGNVPHEGGTGTLLYPYNEGKLAWNPHLRSSRKSDRRQFRTFPTFDLNSGKALLDAATQHNNLERLNMTEEIRQRALHLEQKPFLEFDYRRSVKEKDPFDESINLRENAPAQKAEPAEQYRKMHWWWRSQFPGVLYFLGNTQFGENSADLAVYKNALADTLSIIEANPFAALVLMGNMIEPGLSRKSNRDLILRQYIERLSPLAQQGKILGIGLDKSRVEPGGMRSQYWKKTIGDSSPVMPGTLLSETLRAPLFNNGARLNLAVGSKQQRADIYNILLQMETSKAGSSKYVINHLRAADEFSYESENNVVVGPANFGTGLAGVGSVYKPHSQDRQTDYIAHGSFSIFGTNNRTHGSTGGQSLVFMPDGRMRFPAPTKEIASEIHDHLYLSVALSLLGITPESLAPKKSHR